MRTMGLLLVASVPWVAFAAAVPETVPQLTVIPAPAATADACFAAARDLERPDPATCDVLIARSGSDALTLAATHNNRGLILAAMNQPEQALGDFEAALALQPDMVEARLNRANMLLELARYPEALTAYDAALAGMTVNRHIALFDRALAHRALGNVEQAARDMAAARSLAAGLP